MRRGLLLWIGLWCGCFATAMAQAPNADLAVVAAKVNAADKAVQLEALDDLAAYGAAAKVALPQLLKALDSPDLDVQWHACRTLGAIGAEAQPAVGPLTGLLKAEDLRVRAYAAFALGRIGKGAEPAADALIQLAFDPQPLVRRAAIRALRQIDPPQSKTLPVVLDVLKRGDMSIIMPALVTLAQEGKKEVPRLREAMKTPEARYWVLLVLAEIGPDAADAVPDVIPLLKDEDPELRMQALLALGEMGPAAKAAETQIVESLKTDTYAATRYAAVYALGKIGVQAGPVEMEVRKLASGDDPFLSTISIWALARSNPDNKALVQEAVQKFVQAFKSDNVDVRRVAARAVAEFDFSHDVLAPVLIEALRDKDNTVVGNAVSALSAMGPKALPQIKGVLNDKSLRHYGLVLIGRMGPAAQEAVPNLIQALEQPPTTPDDVEFVREAQFALASIGPGAVTAVPALVKSLSTTDEVVQASAALALGKIGPGAIGAVPALRTSLRSESFIVRLASVRALLEIQPGQPAIARVAAPLLRQALSHPQPMVRAESARAISELGELGKQAIPDVKKLLQDEDQMVREAAQATLQKLGG